MTKKELEKEAEDYADENDICVCDEEYWAHSDIKQAYLAGTKPREKQIQIDAEQIRALQKQNGELTDKVKGLETQIEKMKSDVIECFGSEYNVLVAKLLNKWEIKEK